MVADTEKVSQAGKNIVNLSNDFLQEVNEFYKLVGTIPYNSDAWDGKNARKYSKMVLQDKQIYLNFAEQIKNFGNLIVSTSNKIDNFVSDAEKV